MHDNSAFLILGGLFALACLIASLLYLASMSKCLAAVPKPRRVMSQWWVLLLLVPFLSLIWQFVVVHAVSKSLMAEARERGVVIISPKGRWFGFGYSAIAVAALVPVQVLRLLLGLGGLVLWGFWWQWAVNLRKAVEQAPGGEGADAAIA